MVGGGDVVIAGRGYVTELAPSSSIYMGVSSGEGTGGAGTSGDGIGDYGAG